MPAAKSSFALSQSVTVPASIDYPRHGFTITHRAADSKARLGILTTPHGDIQTPAIIFCATKAAMKALSPEQMKAAKSQIILSNTYHLMIQPGAETIAALGGLHKMMGWDGPMLSDSGGFQIFAMGHGGVADEIKGRNSRNQVKSLLKIEEEGATFRSYLDGAILFLSPEKAMEIQRAFGVDLLMQFDECTPFHVEHDYTEKAMQRSQRWGDRSLKRFSELHDGAQGLYGIISGGIYPDLRAQSAAWTAERPFFGTAIGDCLGGSKKQMYEVVEMALENAHPERPVHLLGIGAIDDVFENVARGVDTFDCVHPTRIARHGWALAQGVPQNRVNLRNARFRCDAGPIDPQCNCPVCLTFSCGYIHHLLKAGELLALTLLSQHNVATMNRLFGDVRTAIASGTLAEAKARWIVPVARRTGFV